MTEQEILEGNVLIARFLNVEHIERVEENDPRYYIDNISYKPMELKYHTSWDWLMPVIEKFDSAPYKQEFHIGISAHRECIDANLILYDIDKTFEALVDAIKWYNTFNSQSKN